MKAMIEIFFEPKKKVNEEEQEMTTEKTEEIQEVEKRISYLYFADEDLQEFYVGGRFINTYINGKMYYLIYDESTFNKMVAIIERRNGLN